jgi:hypothetical protein
VISKIRAVFNPLQCIALAGDSLIDKTKTRKQYNFDAIWTFEIVGHKFEQQTNPLAMGVFNSAKCYYIVCVKDLKVAIYLWRGIN